MNGYEIQSVLVVASNTDNSAQLSDGEMKLVAGVVDLPIGHIPGALLPCTAHVQKPLSILKVLPYGGWSKARKYIRHLVAFTISSTFREGRVQRIFYRKNYTEYSYMGRLIVVLGSVLYPAAY